MPEDRLPLDRNPLGDWSCHVFPAGPANYILVANTSFLYSTLFSPDGVTHAEPFLLNALSGIHARLAHDGFELPGQPSMLPADSGVAFGKLLNRSEIARLTNLVQCAQRLLLSPQPSLRETCARLNDRPFKSLKFRTPKEALYAVIECRH
ncbi:MAG: hypothetical protein JXR94_00985 [Candidatus Hydrogenedentes bacterium]|nr:hypothetical protein [Candidatus Hydrogenedentota bacterium]